MTGEDHDVIAAMLDVVCINANQFQIPDLRTNLLAAFSASGLLRRFFAFDSAPRKQPPVLIGVLDQQHLSVTDEHYAHPDRDRARKEILQYVEFVQQVKNIAFHRNA